MPDELDFTATNHGSIIMLTPLSEEAHVWCRDYLPDDCQKLGESFAIEPRYFGPIGQGINEDGFRTNFICEER